MQEVGASNNMISWCFEAIQSSSVIAFQNLDGIQRPSQFDSGDLGDRLLSGRRISPGDVSDNSSGVEPAHTATLEYPLACAGPSFGISAADALEAL